MLGLIEMRMLDAAEHAKFRAINFPRGNNGEIAQAWMNGEKMRNERSTFWTDGLYVYSYGLTIGYTSWKHGIHRKTVYDQRGRHSRTTSQHVAECIRPLTFLEQPIDDIWV